MNADGSVFSRSELSGKVHPLRPKPVVNSDGVQPHWLATPHRANDQRQGLSDELSRISTLRRNELCDSSAEHLLPPSFPPLYVCAEYVSVRCVDGILLVPVELFE
jgi:hypothetical protein